jgi:hypothetical protein
MKKKIMPILRKMQSSLTVKMNKQPLITTLIILLFINIVILLLSALISSLVAPEVFPDLITALSKGSLKWILSANSLNNLQGVSNALYIVAALTVVIGMVLTTGTIIALTTNALKDFFTKKTQAKGKLILENHIVILNWNSKVPEILINLMHKEELSTVLILSDKDKEYVKSQFNSAASNVKFGKKAKINMVIRQGDPFSSSDLKDICIDQAKSIAIMASEENTALGVADIEKTDLNALRLLLIVGGATAESKSNIVVEAATYGCVQTLNDLSSTVLSLKNKIVSVFSFNRKLGQIMAQTVMHPQIFDVILNMLSFEGEEFYTADKVSLEDYLASYTESIPVIAYDKLFVFASSKDKVEIKREQPYKTARRLKLNLNEVQKESLSLFIIGDNKRSPYMLETLNGYEDIKNVHISTYDKSDNAGLIRDIQECKGAKQVMILSDDSVDGSYYDANVFLTLIELRKHLGDQKDLPIIAEILDVKNKDCVMDFGVSDTIISNKIISLLLAQLLDNHETRMLYESLFIFDVGQTGGIDIHIDKVKNMLDINQDLTFKSNAELVNAFYYSTKKKYMLIGYRDGGDIIYLNNDMDAEKKLTLNADTELICIKY